LAEAIAWGQVHFAVESEQQRKATAPDYAQLSVEFADGVVGYIVLSHASYFRKGFAPELELHGTDGSLSVDRITGELKFADSPDPARLLETVADQGDCNRFERYVFPALRERAAGGSEHPGLDDGWRVQVFTDAAFASAQRGAWVKLSEFDE
jgi:predicted dehydrogenase